MTTDPATWGAITVMAAATVGGASLAVASRGRRDTVLRLAAAVLVAIVVADLVPEVVRDVAEAGPSRWVLGVVCAAGFAAAAVASRWACGCGTHPATASGAAISLHRALEGAAVALTGSAAVVVALVLHAGGEGFALGTLDPQRRGGVRLLLLLACLSPAVGAAALGGAPMPDAVSTVVTAAVAGALTAGAALMVTAARRPVLAPGA